MTWRCPRCGGATNLQRKWRHAEGDWKFKCYDCYHRWTAKEPANETVANVPLDNTPAKA